MFTKDYYKFPKFLFENITYKQYVKIDYFQVKKGKILGETSMVYSVVWQSGRASKVTRQETANISVTDSVFEKQPLPEGVTEVKVNTG